MVFINTFVTYVVIMAAIVAIAIAGIFFGKYLRDRKDKKK